MLPLQILYIISGFIALSAGALQLSKLLKKRNSDEFNLGTWLMWTGTQTVSTAYALSLGDALLVFISSAWVTFYFIMSVLIIRFSSSRSTLFRSVPHGHTKTAAAPLPIEVAPDSASPLELAAEPSK